MTISFVYTTIITIVIVCVSRGIKGSFFGLFTLLAAMEVNKITSSVAMIGSQEINCTDIVLAALFVCAVMLLLQKVRIKKSLLAGGMVVLVLAVISLTYNLFFPYDGTIITAGTSWDGLFYGTSSPQHVEINLRSMLILIRLFIFIIIVWCAASVLTRNDFLQSASYVVAFSKVHIVFGIFELLTKSVFGSSVAVDISNALFPAFSSFMSGVITRGELTVLQGFTREASHFALALSIFLVILVLLNCAGRGRRTDVFWGFAAFLLLALSAAFTAIVGIAITAIVVARYRSVLFAGINKRIRLIIYFLFLTLTLLALVVLAGGIQVGNIYYVDKLANVVENIGAIMERRYGSISESYDALPRIASIIECLRAFLERPLFGIGPGTVIPYSGTSAILSQYGILFTMAWFSFLIAYSQSLCGQSGGRFFGLLVFLYGLVLYTSGYEYTFTWILLGGLFSSKKASLKRAESGYLRLPSHQK